MPTRRIIPSVCIAVKSFLIVVCPIGKIVSNSSTEILLFCEIASKIFSALSGHFSGHFMILGPVFISELHWTTLLLPHLVNTISGILAKPSKASLVIRRFKKRTKIVKKKRTYKFSKGKVSKKMDFVTGIGKIGRLSENVPVILAVIVKRCYTSPHTIKAAAIIFVIRTAINSGLCLVIIRCVGFFFL